MLTFSPPIPENKNTHQLSLQTGDRHPPHQVAALVVSRDHNTRAEWLEWKRSLSLALSEDLIAWK